MLKKGDFFIYAVCFAAIVISGILVFCVKSPGKTVIIEENNKTVYKGSLFTNKTVKLSGNTVEIKNGEADITDADCKNQICVNHKRINKSGDSIICLPNKVIVKIE